MRPASAGLHLPDMLQNMKFDLELLNRLVLRHHDSAEIVAKMRQLYPKATDDELQQGHENLKSYLRLAFKIARRLLTEETGALTRGSGVSTMQTQRSNSNEAINQVL